MIKRELKLNSKSLFLWLIITIFIFLIVFMVYPSMNVSEQIDDMMKMFPEDLLKLFNFDLVNISTAFGWMKTEGYVLICLLIAIYSSILGSTILLKEENDKTIFFLYSKPVSRSMIVTSKIVCGCINIFLYVVLLTLFNYVGLNIIESVNVKEFLLISFLPLLLGLMIFFLTLFISTLFRRTKTAMGIGIGITLFSYICQILGGMSDKIAFFKDISLFEFVSSRYIIEYGKINYSYLWLGLGLILVLNFCIYYLYKRREFY